MTPSKMQEYISAIQQFSEGWWNEILKLSNHNSQLISDVAKQAAINYVNGKSNNLRPTVLMANEAINILQQKALSENDIEAVKQLRTWFEKLGISPGKVVVIADFVDLIEQKFEIEKGRN